jgi:hypothetical protein
MGATLKIEVGCLIRRDVRRTLMGAQMKDPSLTWQEDSGFFTSMFYMGITYLTPLESRI